jgi:hypothetical protein
MTETKLQEAPKILNNLIDGLKQASGGCSQLIHGRQDMGWLVLRQAIDLATEGCISVATFQATKVTAVRPM